MIKKHTFHVPVMGVAYTIDTPLKLAPLGINSVIPLGDDNILERMRKMYCEKFNITYTEITDIGIDYRAQRISSYLNLIQELAEKKFEELKNVAIEKTNLIKEYISLLPDSEGIKEEFIKLTETKISRSEIREWIKERFAMGSIDVNIMTKIDKDNYRNNEKLPVEYNDAHAAFRGFAKSNLHSSIVLSAGMNPRLYAYMEQFEDFYPNEKGELKKKITLKVSDFRSAIIQGKFLAKKGIWVSEYRVESGLNCGGHAFATEGFLMGPILAEFRDKREELIETTHQLYIQALETKGKTVPQTSLPIKITAQGGVGTAEEHKFLLSHYNVDSVGWGTPFLLVPEVSTVDDETLQKLIQAQEEDLYLSGISPLGVAFNNLRNNAKDEEKQQGIDKGKPGRVCTKRYLITNTEFTEKPICTASRQYQQLKIADLKKQNLTEQEYKTQYESTIERSCICTGLIAPALIVNDLKKEGESTAVSVCPGPGLAYFSKQMKLNEMVDHIYGRTNVLNNTKRPMIFVKELDIYIQFLKNILPKDEKEYTEKNKKRFLAFINNLEEGISYYQELFTKHFKKEHLLEELDVARKKMLQIKEEAYLSYKKALN